MILIRNVAARYRQMHFDTVNQRNPSYPKSELDLGGMKYEVITQVSSRERLIVSSRGEWVILTQLIHGLNHGHTAIVEISLGLSHPLA